MVYLIYLFYLFKVWGTSASGTRFEVGCSYIYIWMAWLSEPDFVYAQKVIIQEI